MTDLVTRLRQWQDTQWIAHLGIGCTADEPHALAVDCRDAADEIERLREANKWLDAGRTEIVPILTQRAERAEAELADALAAEARNRKAWDSALQQAMENGSLANDLRAERDEARALLDDMWRLVEEPAMCPEDFWTSVQERHAALREGK